jgi:hypothetical protein
MSSNPFSIYTAFSARHSVLDDNLWLYMDMNTGFFGYSTTNYSGGSSSSPTNVNTNNKIAAWMNSSVRYDANKLPLVTNFVYGFYTASPSVSWTTRTAYLAIYPGQSYSATFNFKTDRPVTVEGNNFAIDSYGYMSSLRFSMNNTNPSSTQFLNTSPNLRVTESIKEQFAVTNHFTVSDSDYYTNLTALDFSTGGQIWFSYDYAITNTSKSDVYYLWGVSPWFVSSGGGSIRDHLDYVTFKLDADLWPVIQNMNSDNADIVAQLVKMNHTLMYDDTGVSDILNSAVSGEDSTVTSDVALVKSWVNGLTVPTTTGFGPVSESLALFTSIYNFFMSVFPFLSAVFVFVALSLILRACLQ